MWHTRWDVRLKTGRSTMPCVCFCRTCLQAVHGTVSYFYQETLHNCPARLISLSLLRQTILRTGSFDRDELEEIESEMSQKTRLWRGIQMFEERLETWESTSFESLDLEAMEKEVARYVGC